ncbi:MAG: NAD-dependent epimerase/dehydratase family protein, partial [Rhodospirillales bacterium]|nr:NAD-dependent epimerase/dehydratase family protein [Rhodospirillales bacterium]
MKRVLVTGGSGFIGRQALAPLCELGYEIHALDLRPLASSDVTWYEIDLFDTAAVAGAVDRIGADHCLHLAWDVSPGFWDAPSNTDWVAASLNLLRAFHAAGGRRFVSVGTCAEYDWSRPRDSLTEDGPHAPSTLYGVAKDALRRMIEGYAGRTGLSWGWGVLFLSYGPYERPERLIPAVINDLLAGRKARTTAGTQIRDILDVRDQGAALAAL